MNNKQGENRSPIRILFFIGDLGIGGKERRLVELLGYLQKRGEYRMLLVLTTKDVGFPKFLHLGIETALLKKKTIISKLNYFFHFYKIVRDFKPEIIHTWGRVQTLYALPSVLLTKTKLVNGQITSAPPKRSFVESFIDKVNFRLSDIVLSNSKAGLDVYKPSQDKAGIVYNGIDLDRFENLPDASFVKDKFRVDTKYLVLMVANFTPNKDYERFFRLGRLVMEQRKDITWMGIGYFEEGSDLIKNCRDIIGNSPYLRIQPKSNEIETLANACDIGVLFSNAAVHGEGISNAVIEFMALGKPVVANDAGGTREVVINNETGYLVQNEPLDQIAEQIKDLLDQTELRARLGQNGRSLIRNQFSLEKMGLEFEIAYTNLLEE